MRRALAEWLRGLADRLDPEPSWDITLLDPYVFSTSSSSSNYTISTGGTRGKNQS